MFPILISNLNIPHLNVPSTSATRKTGHDEIGTRSIFFTTSSPVCDEPRCLDLTIYGTELMHAIALTNLLTVACK
jgi:hypothetical protein